MRKTQEEMKAKFDKMMDEKIKATEELTDDIKESAANAAEKVAEKGEEAFSDMKKAAKKAAKKSEWFFSFFQLLNGRFPREDARFPLLTPAPNGRRAN